MKTAKKAFLALALAALWTTARAESFGLRPYQAVYGDAGGVMLKYPEGVACNDERLIVADAGNARLLPFQLKDGAAVAGTEIKLPQVTYPTRVQLDRSGNLFVLDGRKRQIAHLDPAGKFVEYVKFKPEGPFTSAHAFALDSAANVYVLDTAGKVTVLDAAGAVTRQIQPPPVQGRAMFTDVAVDSGGKVYVVDAVTATLFVADAGASAMKPLSKSLKDVINFPSSMSVLGQRLLVVDQNGHGIAVVGLDGTFLGRTLGMGWSEGLVYYPAQLCVNGRNEAFVADRSNNRVQIFLPAQ